MRVVRSRFKEGRRAVWLPGVAALKTASFWSTAPILRQIVIQQKVIWIFMPRERGTRSCIFVLWNSSGTPVVSTRIWVGQGICNGLVTICTSTLKKGQSKISVGEKGGPKFCLRSWPFSTSPWTMARAWHKQKVKELFPVRTSWDFCGS